jgi:hypothetical protein
MRTDHMSNQTLEHCVREQLNLALDRCRSTRPCPELNDWNVLAADGHAVKHATHAARDEKDRHAPGLPGRPRELPMIECRTPLAPWGCRSGPARAFPAHWGYLSLGHDPCPRSRPTRCRADDFLTLFTIPLLFDLDKHLPATLPLEPNCLIRLRDLNEERTFVRAVIGAVEGKHDAGTQRDREFEYR